jgi:hypothetical protein
VSFKSKKSKGAVDPAEVARAADLLQQAYGEQALDRARRVEAEATSPEFAAAVTAEIERRLRNA